MPARHIENRSISRQFSCGRTFEDAIEDIVSGHIKPLDSSDRELICSCDEILSHRLPSLVMNVIRHLQKHDPISQIARHHDLIKALLQQEGVASACSQRVQCHLKVAHLCAELAGANSHTHIPPTCQTPRHGWGIV